MDTTRTRTVPLALTALVALFSALVALAISNGHDAHAHGGAAQAADRAPVSHAELALRNDMRRLWEDHITWTRRTRRRPSGGCSTTRPTSATR